MSDLEKLARKVKTARKEFDAAVKDTADAYANWQEAQKIQTLAAKALDETKYALMNAADPRTVNL